MASFAFLISLAVLLFQCQVLAEHQKKAMISTIPQLVGQDGASGDNWIPVYNYPFAANGVIVIQNISKATLIIDYLNGTISSIPDERIWIHHWGMDLPNGMMCGLAEQYQSHTLNLPDPYRMIFSKHDVKNTNPGAMLFSSVPAKVHLECECVISENGSWDPDVRRIHPMTLMHKHANVNVPGSPEHLLQFRNPWTAAHGIQIVNFFFHPHQGIVAANITKVTEGNTYTSSNNKTYGLSTLCEVGMEYAPTPCLHGCGESCNHESEVYSKQLVNAHLKCPGGIRSGITVQKGETLVAQITMGGECTQKDIMMCWKAFFWKTGDVGYDRSPMLFTKLVLQNYTPLESRRTSIYDAYHFPDSPTFFKDMLLKYDYNPPGSQVEPGKLYVKGAKHVKN